MSSHPLQQRVAAVRARAARLGWLYGAGWFAVSVLVAVAVAGSFDYWLRFQDHGVRWIFSLAALGALVWNAFYWLSPAWRQRRNLLATAERIEQRFPQFHERLTSAVAFLDQTEDNILGGSAALRKTVIAEAESVAADVDFQEAIDARAPKRAIVGAAIAAAVVLLMIALDPAGAALAASRLVSPWSEQRWPLRNSLHFTTAPTKIAAGEDFEFELFDQNGRLPDEVLLELRHPNGDDAWIETKPMKPLGERMVYRLDNVRQPLAYRARGGDDNTMPWTELEVVVPPTIVDLSVRVQPPEYSGRGVENTGRVVRALAGSSLMVQGRFDKPVTSARLLRQDGASPPLKLAIGTGGRSFTFPAAGQPAWQIDKSAEYAFELADGSGLVSGQQMRLEIQAIADSPPTVSLELPADHTFVTPRALLPIKALVKDDLAIQSIQLKYVRPDSSEQEEQTIELYRGPPVGELGSSEMASSEGDSRTIDQAWDLSHIAGLAPGNVLAMRIVAEDYLPQTAESQVRRLTLISDTELENRVVQRQASILGQLTEVLRLQREARSQVAALEIRLQETGMLAPQDIDQLQSAELSQRQVARLLADPQEGIAAQIHSLLKELADNRVEGQAVVRRMNDLLAKIAEINEQELPSISQQLISTLKEARARRGDTSNACDDVEQERRALGAIGAEQDRVIGTLEGLLGELSQWDNFSRLAREVSQVRQEQEKLRHDTEGVRLKAAVSQQLQLSADDRATARQIGQRQLELARRFDKLQTRMEELLERLRQSDPLAAGTLADALEAGRRLAIGGQMRDAARSLNEQQLGPAERAQKATLDSLVELLDLLANRRDHELAQTVKSLREARTELKGLIDRQAALQAEIDAAAAEQNEQERKRQLQKLTKEAEQIAQEVEQLSRKLERLAARRAAESAESGAASMRGAGQSAAAGNGDAAQRQSRDAQRLLDEAREQLQQDIQQAEEDLLREQLTRLEQVIAGVLARQQSLLAETLRLEQLRARQRGELDRGQQGTLRNLAAEQRSLADEVAQMTARLEGVEAFVFALDIAQRQMVRASSSLQRGDTGNAPQESQQAAVTSLEQLLSALAPEEPAANEDQPPPAGEQNPMPPGEEAGIRSIAELKLLKLLQEELNRRTQTLQFSAQNKFTSDQLQELAALSQEQGRLADMVLDLIKAAADNPEEVPAVDDAEAKPNGQKLPMKETLDDALLRDLM